MNKTHCLIGCKEKTWEEWDKWFAGKEEFETERGTKEFELIHNGYLCAKQFKKTLNIWEKKTNHENI